ncbi:hypothetical protein ALQ54_01432 [Pseudomonas syringae]|uniref:hypothetical protein n=1 Tax=Pseudomonas syringae TaxID=317 RepID=UPI000EFD46DA|nr:hypothetical protein [Pseudomonas syringae]RMN72132.1 hypothetical protein ALQ54_01432 [Pseudomonas syringae]
MAKLYVEDISRQDFFGRIYEISVFSCGYEERSVNVASIIRVENIGSPLVFGFEGEKSKTCLTNESIFKDRLLIDVVDISYGETHKIIGILRAEVEKLIFGKKALIKVLVDYSSMPRLWYSEILNFFKNYDSNVKFELDFVYSVGEHAYSDQPQQLGDPIVLPGCEAVATYSKRTVAIFGLGFDSGAPICMHGKIEPDNTYALIARPGALEDYSSKTYSINSDFIEESVDEVVYSPLFSVKQTYDSLREIFFPFRTSAITVIVPFGPKPHALAAIIAAMNYPSVTCLYSSTGSRPSVVTATSELVLSRIYKDEDQAEN